MLSILFCSAVHLLTCPSIGLDWRLMPVSRCPREISGYPSAVLMRRGVGH